MASKPATKRTPNPYNSDEDSDFDGDLSDIDATDLPTDHFLPIANSFPSHSTLPSRLQPPLIKFLPHLTKRTIRLIGTTFFILMIFLYFTMGTLKRGGRYTMHSLGLSGPSCYFPPPVTVRDRVDVEDIEWERFAYVLYATDEVYLCNAVMMFERLGRLKSKADRVLLYPQSWDVNGEGDGPRTRMLLKARDEFGVKLKGIEVLHVNQASWFGPNWSDSYTKLLAFNLTQYDRVLTLDTDSTLLAALDSLFLLPPSPIILPRAYWLTHPLLSSHIMLLTPSSQSFATLLQTVKQKAGHDVYDMEIINTVFSSTCQTLPWRSYALLTGEFRSPTHLNYLRGGPESVDPPSSSSSGAEVYTGDGKEPSISVELGGEEDEWDPDVAIEEAKLVHFSDHPLGKPWTVTMEQVKEVAPACTSDEWAWVAECRGRDLWLDLYLDFWERRKNVCGVVGYNG